MEEIENLYTPFRTPCTTTFGIGNIQHHHTEEIVELNQFQNRRINRRRLSSIANLKPDIGALAKKSNDNALSLVLKIANE